MKYAYIIAILFLLGTTLAAACQGVQPNAGIFGPSTPVSQQAAAKASVPEWQKTWDETVAAAKQEGELLIYLNAPSEARVLWPDAFDKKFGIKMNIVMGSGAEIASRLDAEYRAGIYQVDAFLPGTTSAMGSRNQGFLAPLEPMLILPENKDPNVWLGGKLPMFDKQGTIIAYLSMRVPPVIYNTDMVKQGEINSYLDLLKPQYKGKVVLFDPTVPGAGNFWATGLSMELGADKANEYFTALIKDQGTLVTRDMRQQMEWVARGKYPLAVWAQTPAVVEFLKVSAPIAAAEFKEMSGVSPSNGGIGIPTKPAHPNAVRVFLNWFLSREGQALAVKAINAPSTRIDVPPEGVPPMLVVDPKAKFFVQSEDFTTYAIQWMDTWKKIFVQ